MSGWNIIGVAIAVAILCGLCYALSPKGENQTYALSSVLKLHNTDEARVWRMTSILTLVSMYLMWMITYNQDL